MTVANSLSHLLSRWLPAWLQHYRRDQATQDGIAGLVVTVLLVPQSLAYAMLAGLPPHVGMYASILPLLAYAAFGSSMTLAVGPVAVASLMTASALAPFAAQGSPECLSLAILLAILGGLQLMVMGALRLAEVEGPGSGPAQARGPTARARPSTFRQCACGDAGLGSKLLNSRHAPRPTPPIVGASIVPATQCQPARKLPTNAS